MATSAAGHRVIGIRFVLKHFKQEGLIEEDIMYPQPAVSGIKDRITQTAQRWYARGAERGAIEALRAISEGEILVVPGKDGVTFKFKKSKITWKRALNVTVGKKKVKVMAEKYSIKTEDLGS